MIEKIIEWSVRNKLIVVSLSLIVLGASIWALKNTPLDAIPDLSPPQVIVYTKWQGQSPSVVEDQITYPVVSTLLSAPEIETVRGISSFETSAVYVIFKEGTDIYWARSRVLEYLSQIKDKLPKTAEVTLGPDATGVGWVYQYALYSDKRNLWQLRTLQDWYLKYTLLGVDGVSEVASIGGFVKGYQITLNPQKLRAYDISLKQVISSLKMNNNDTGGRIIESNGFEFIIQGIGYIKTLDDIKDITVKITPNGIPVRIKDIARVELVPMNRRGMADLNGLGEVVGGIVVMRFGENAYQVIQRVKEKIKEIKENLPEDIKIITTYDRSQLIEKAVNTLKRTLIEESIIVLIVIGIFLFHFRSSLVIIITLPLAVITGFLFMKFFNITSNIMSLGGIAIAIGAMVDAAIVMVENAHKHLEKLRKEKGEYTDRERIEAIVKAAKQVGRPIFFALLLIVVSFLPVFALSGQEGMLFKPLAFTKTFTMLAASVFAVTLVPILMVWLIKGRIVSEEKNPVNWILIKIYSPIIKLTLKVRYLVIILAVVAIGMVYPIYKKLSWEFMPMLNEQTFMYMPVTPYGISITQARELTQLTDKILASFPEVDTVFGKAGRAETATDPAPLSMIETIITFKPKEYWREGVTFQSLMQEMEEKLQVPGLTNSWTYPIRGRIDMLLTGIRTPLGIKLYGDDLDKLQEYAGKIEKALQKLPESMSVFADRVAQGYFLNIKIDRKKIARYGLSIEDVESIIQMGIGGMPVSTIYHGLERYPLLVRYEKDYRENIEALKNLIIPTPDGRGIPLKAVADVYYDEAPSVIKSEKGMKVVFVYITPHQNVTPEEYVEKAKKVLSQIKLPQGFFIEWAGQSQYLEHAKERLMYIIPLTVAIIFLLVYFTFRSIKNTLIILLSIPFALLGGLWYIDYLNFNMSIAVVVGFLALLGVAAETAIVMIIYLEEAVKSRLKQFKTITEKQFYDAIYEGAVLRIRPKMMTVSAILAGLLPIMYITGVGSEVMQRIAAPMIGGVVSSAILTLVIIPAIYTVTKKYELKRNKLLKS
ncbi:MAG TPA: CusA/CzcA family heavy metal efflux RND transporter [Persephonella sp.]|uniref:Cation efflux system protein CusA n=1 Tax=Persephonella marina (strain DSM 14350 / EX-H1) TaxID=123214 RepID=C0QPP5_PERMH|nr:MULTISPECIES: CusA/CzcA family heavy metal efflux RND transporter [Persephonella]ACO04178.1 cation efflux system protein CusA [Persephonella marina EX-H1]HCB69744.1 CusA/CzcA family heavy metal efflux RND transporter [Persephonella sp.]